MKNSNEPQNPAIVGNLVLSAALLSQEDKRALAKEKFLPTNYAYRGICQTEMFLADEKGGFRISSGSRNYEDVTVNYSMLNDNQKLFLKGKVVGW